MLHTADGSSILQQGTNFVRVLCNGSISDFDSESVGSIPTTRTSYASETWQSERSYIPFSARLAFLREFDPLRWYHYAPVDKLAKSSLSKGEVVLGSTPSRGTKFGCNSWYEWAEILAHDMFQA